MSDFGETLDDMDIEAFLNIRDWLQDAIETRGGVITDSGIGAGRADLGFEINGAPFGVQIRPRVITCKHKYLPTITDGEICIKCGQELAQRAERNE